MSGLDAILDVMRPQVADCPDVSLIWAAMQAARQLCREARCYRHTVAVDIRAGYGRYRLVPNWFAFTDEATAERDSVQVIGVKAVQIGGVPYEPSSPEEFNAPDGYGRVVIYEPDEVEVFPVPAVDRDGGLTVNCVLNLKASATMIPFALQALYGDQIAKGGIAALKAMPNVAWSDPRGAAGIKAEFDADIAMARFRADKQGRPRAFRTIPAWGSGAR